MNEPVINNENKSIYTTQETVFMIKENILEKLRNKEKSHLAVNFLTKAFSKTNLLFFSNIEKDLALLLDKKDLSEFIVIKTTSNKESYFNIILKEVLQTKGKKSELLELIYNSPYISNIDKTNIFECLINRFDIYKDELYEENEINIIIPNIEIESLEELKNYSNYSNSLINELLTKNNLSDNVYINTSNHKYLLEIIKENKDIEYLNKKIEEVFMIFTEIGKEENIDTNDLDNNDLEIIENNYLLLLGDILKDKFFRDNLDKSLLLKIRYFLLNKLDTKELSNEKKDLIKNIINHCLLLKEYNQKELIFDKETNVRNFLSSVSVEDLYLVQGDYLFNELKLSIKESNISKVSKSMITNNINGAFLDINKLHDLDNSSNVSFKRLFNFLNKYSDIIIKDNLDLFEFICNKLNIEKDKIYNQNIINCMFGKNISYFNTAEKMLKDHLLIVENGFKSNGITDTYLTEVHLLTIFYSNPYFMEYLYNKNTIMFQKMTNYLQMNNFLFQNKLSHTNILFDNKNINNFEVNDSNLVFFQTYIANIVKIQIMIDITNNYGNLEEFDYSTEIFDLLIRNFRNLEKDKKGFLLKVFENISPDFLYNIQKELNKFKRYENLLPNATIKKISINDLETNKLFKETISKIEVDKLFNILGKIQGVQGLMGKIKTKSKIKHSSFNF